MTIPERLPEEYKGAQIRSHEVEKNNGLVLHGITVTPEDSNIAPNVYLDGYFKQYEEGKDLDAIMDQITHTVVSNIKAPEEFGNITVRSRGADGIVRIHDIARVEVGNRIAVGRASQPHGFPGHILETLDQRGLTISTMAQQADVSDILYGIRHR